MLYDLKTLFNDDFSMACQCAVSLLTSDLPSVIKNIVL